MPSLTAALVADLLGLGREVLYDFNYRAEEIRDIRFCGGFGNSSKCRDRGRHALAPPWKTALPAGWSYGPALPLKSPGLIPYFRISL